MTTTEVRLRAVREVLVDRLKGAATALEDADEMVATVAYGEAHIAAELLSLIDSVSYIEGEWDRWLGTSVIPMPTKINILIPVSKAMWAVALVGFTYLHGVGLLDHVHFGVNAGGG